MREAMGRGGGRGRRGDGGYRGVGTEMEKTEGGRKTEEGCQRKGEQVEGREPVGTKRWGQRGRGGAEWKRGHRG